MVPLSDEKQDIREKVWRSLSKAKICESPWGRIPDFIGAREAAERLRRMDLYQESEVVSVNPDSPQRPVREMVLRDGKKLLVGTPKLEKGFILLENLRGNECEASTLSGLRKYGKPISLDKLPKIDIKVVGSVAVTRDGGRLGKGTGYFDLGYLVFRELKVLDDSTPIITTVHDLQMVERIPMTADDVPVDVIITPTQTIETHTVYSKPKGVPWSELERRKIGESPLIKALIKNRDR